MEQKMVVFKGADLPVVQNDEGVWGVPLKVMCEHIGIDGEGQRAKLARLAESGLKWPVAFMMKVTASDGKRYDTACLPVDSVPMWAATVDISRVEKTETRALLIAYQDEAARVLARAVKGEQSSFPMDEARLRYIIREELLAQQAEPPVPLPTLTHVQHTHGSFALYEVLYIKKSRTIEELARRLPCREQTVHDVALTHCNPTRILRGRFQDLLGIPTEAWDKPLHATMERVDRPVEALLEGAKPAMPALPAEKKRPNKDDLLRVAEALKLYPNAPPRVIIAAARIKRSIGYAALRALANSAAGELLH
jgi:hypothetical protein